MNAIVAEAKNMKDPFDVVRDFEKELCLYTGAKYAVTTTSCTMALLLACKYNKVGEVTIPANTYVGAPMSIINAGGKVKFDEPWNWQKQGFYQLKYTPIYDSARLFTSDMWKNFGEHPTKWDLKTYFSCVSFHWSKTLGISQGGAILHNDDVADPILRKMRFDGRTENIPPKEDNFDVIGYHAYMSPATAAEGLTRLALLPKNNKPLIETNYTDLRKYDIFK